MSYVLAIKLAFYGIFRIGEIKALTWDDTENNMVNIRQQLVEERTLQEDMTLSTPYRILKNPKGNPYYSIRTEFLPQERVKVLKKMKELNPDGTLLFMHEGRPLTTDTFNRRLKKYCTKMEGIPYFQAIKYGSQEHLCCMMPDKAIDIQPLLGHSTLNMTQHYIGERVQEQEASQMAQILGKRQILRIFLISWIPL